MKKSRLKKVALMTSDIFEKQVDQISDKGRDILKAIEEYKFFVEQVSRVVKNDPKLTQMVINKKKNLDQASQQIYDVVFDIENMDITTTYYNQQQATELSKGPTQNPISNPNLNNSNPKSIPNATPNNVPNNQQPAPNAQPSNQPNTPNNQVVPSTDQNQNKEKPENTTNQNPDENEKEDSSKDE